jgi:hypothetical protein
MPKDFAAMLSYGLNNLPMEPPDDPIALSTSPNFTNRSSISGYAIPNPISNANVSGPTNGALFAPAIPGIEMAAARRRDSAYCKLVKNACIAQCSETSLPSRDYGFRFWTCQNKCMLAHGCDP